MTGPHDRSAQSRALRIALVANGLFLGVEVAGGLVFGSLALLADAAHMLSDVGGLAIALVAHGLLSRPSSIRHTYGMQRAEVLGAQLNGVVLLATSGWILYEATKRFGDPVQVEGAGIAAVATLGLLINICSAVFLHRNRGHSLNLRAAFLHMVMDAIGSVGALAAGIAIVGLGRGVGRPRGFDRHRSARRVFGDPPLKGHDPRSDGGNASPSRHGRGRGRNSGGRGGRGGSPPPSVEPGFRHSRPLRARPGIGWSFIAGCTGRWGSDRSDVARAIRYRSRHTAARMRSL